MEGGEKNLTRAISNVWRNSRREVFSLSSDEEDDGEALKWAALEKLPTFVRIRTGILSEDEGQFREIDVKKLGVTERRNLVERLVKTAEEDNEKFLLKLKERIDRVGINLPTIEVRFEHLNVDVEAYVGGRSLPTILNFFVYIFQSRQTNWAHKCILSSSTAGKFEKKSPTNDASGMQIKEALHLQLDVQRRLHEQLEVQRNLQLRIEEQGRQLKMMFDQQQQTTRSLFETHNSNNALPHDLQIPIYDGCEYSHLSSKIS